MSTSFLVLNSKKSSDANFTIGGAPVNVALVCPITEGAITVSDANYALYEPEILRLIWRRELRRVVA